MTMMLFDDRSLPQNRSGKVTRLSDAEIGAKFLEFWEEKPSRLGNNPKWEAEQIFTKLVKSGENCETIIAGVKRFAAECRARRIVGTCYVLQMTRWLRKKMWLNDPDAGPEAQPKSMREIARELRDSAGSDGPGRDG